MIGTESPAIARNHRRTTGSLLEVPDAGAPRGRHSLKNAVAVKRSSLVACSPYIAAFAPSPTALRQTDWK